jgi:hypothetical protein
VYTTVLGNALSGRALTGVMLWMVAAGTYPDYDGFTCRIPGTEEPQAPCDDGPAIEQVLRCAQRMQALNNDPAPPVAAL